MFLLSPFMEYLTLQSHLDNHDSRSVDSYDAPDIDDEEDRDRDRESSTSYTESEVRTYMY